MIYYVFVVFLFFARLFVGNAFVFQSVGSNVKTNSQARNQQIYPYHSPFIAKKSRNILFAKKYDLSDRITVKVKKPLGISLAEVEENAKKGVYIDDIEADGSIAKNGKIRKGFFLMSINQQDVKNADFDSILDQIMALPEQQDIELTFIDYNRVLKGPVTITVESPDQPTRQINALKGLNLRRVLLDNRVEVYDMRGKLSNCGGGGTCTTCAVAIRDNEDWDNISDYEAKRTKKYGDGARLSCLTTIEGDCTVRVRPNPK